MSENKLQVAGVFAVAILLGVPNVSGAAVVGKAVDPSFSGLAGSGEINVTNFVIDNTSGGALAASGFYIDYSSNGDTFGYSGRDGGNEYDEQVFDEVLPFAVSDDSLADSAERIDPVGIIKSTDFDTVFISSDTTNGDNGNVNTAPYSATWTFEIGTTSGGLSVSVDAAAMGDFETQDKFDFTYSLDGGASFLPLFTSAFSSTNEPPGDYDRTSLAFSQGGEGQLDLSIAGQMVADLPPEIIYTLEAGTVYAHTDPMTLEGVFLNNNFQSFTKAIGPTSATSMMIRFTSATDGGSEGFAFRNLTIEDGVVGGGLDGDYNGDNVVDAADYTVWRDGDSPDDSQAGYDLWAANYGATAPINAAAVPEPTAAVLALLAFAGLASRRS